MARARDEIGGGEAGKSGGEGGIEVLWIGGVFYGVDSALKVYFVSIFVADELESVYYVSS